MSLLALTLSAAALQTRIKLTPNMVVSRSSAFQKGTYRILSDENLHRPAITIQGNGIVVDFKGAILEGTPQTTEPSDRKGLGILVRGKNITIKNLIVRGYKVGLLARDCAGLKLVDSDFSHNWKQHLASTLDKEDESDWQSYHHNENDEWLRYGSGIYFRGCSGFEVRNCKAEGGQCGLMMTNSNNGLVWNCDFSFLSGIGIGLYRSSSNRFMHNKIDWCVRGFSYGVYNRGQDSSGILIYEQSNKNVFAYNSVTHGGDGFFLWAGQTTMDTGNGGCNDNLLYGNDFSHSPANGIESTFSRNDFVNNLLLECWHGIWGGYSYENHVVGNVFGHNEEAIAWEHGQDNLVDSNTFVADNVGVNIWCSDPDPNFAFAKERDTSSKNWTITNNTFRDEFTCVLQASRTEGIKLTSNRFVDNGAIVSDKGRVTGLVDSDNRVTAGKPAPHSSALSQGSFNGTANYLARFHTAWNPYQGAPAARKFMPKRMTGGQNAFLDPGALRGWRYILIDDWGPYDFKRPILWPRGKVPGDGSTVYEFEILGPPGHWRLVDRAGVATVTPDHGTVAVGSKILVTLPAGKASNIKLTLEYTGQATTDYRGIVTPAGKPVRFGYSKFFAPIDWTVRFYKWSKSVNPSEAHSVPDESALQEVLKGRPLKELHSDRLDFAGASFDPVTGNDHFLTSAVGVFTVQPGDYVLDMTSDDGARLWLDGKQIIQDAWHYQGPTLYSRNVHLDAGKHTIRIEHFQIDGYAALKVNLRPRK